MFEIFDSSRYEVDVASKFKVMVSAQSGNAKFTFLILYYVMRRVLTPRIGRVAIW